MERKIMREKGLKKSFIQQIDVQTQKNKRKKYKEIDRKRVSNCQHVELNRDC